MRFQLRMGFVVVTPDCRLLNRPVHAFDLAICPGMVHLRQPLINAILSADAAEDVLEG